MIAVLSDTHSHEGHRLAGRAREAVEAADLVVHAGDFVTGSALDAFESVAADLRAVHGNVDDDAVRDRLPATRTVDRAGLRAVVVHGDRHARTGLEMLARERAADLVIVGHSHVPGFEAADGVPVLNPGSHADPRGNPAAHAELDPDGDGLRGRIRRRDGSTLRSFAVPRRSTDG